MKANSLRRDSCQCSCTVLHDAKVGQRPIAGGVRELSFAQGEKFLAAFKGGFRLRTQQSILGDGIRK